MIFIIQIAQVSQLGGSGTELELCVNFIPSQSQAQTINHHPERNSPYPLTHTFISYSTLKNVLQSYVYILI